MGSESWLLFTHVVGAMGLFAALGMEGMNLVALSRVTGAEDRHHSRREP
jgi:hypothetical protein